MKINQGQNLMFRPDITLDKETNQVQEQFKSVRLIGLIIALIFLDWVHDKRMRVIPLVKISKVLKVNDFKVTQHVFVDHFSEDFSQLKFPQFLMLALNFLTDSLDKEFWVVAIRVRKIVLEEIAVGIGVLVFGLERKCSLFGDDVKNGFCHV